MTTDTGLTTQEKNIIKYWITACEDLHVENTESKCQECPIYGDCKDLRKRIWGKDILEDKDYKMDCNFTEVETNTGSKFNEELKAKK